MKKIHCLYDENDFWFIIFFVCVQDFDWVCGCAISRFYRIFLNCAVLFKQSCIKTGLRIFIVASAAKRKCFCTFLASLTKLISWCQEQVLAVGWKIIVNKDGLKFFVCLDNQKWTHNMIWFLNSCKFTDDIKQFRFFFLCKPQMLVVDENLEGG